MKVNNKLESYIKKNIFPLYELNDMEHNLEHIMYVIKRSMKFANQVSKINYDMVYTIASYYDIGYRINANNSEKVSAEILLNDANLKDFFTEDEITEMYWAIMDHRASLKKEPRNVYGKIVVAADKNTLIETSLKRIYSHFIVNNPDANLDEIIAESLNHLLDKYGTLEYLSDNSYFEDPEYKRYLEDVSLLIKDPQLFRNKYIEVNHIDKISENIVYVFDLMKNANKDMSLDQLLYATYKKILNNGHNFDYYRPIILELNNIIEFDYYTKDVDENLKKYVKEVIFPLYEENDKAHGIVHIVEVIRRIFALNDTFNLHLDKNMLFAIASYHDLGKHENHQIHEKIAARKFYEDEVMKKFFNEDERVIIRDAIMDHRSSLKDEPKTVYGKLISSADRNTSIEMVFIRSFFVAHERDPEKDIESYLEFTHDRLSKKYSEDSPENMFFEDETYKIFLSDMRDLLKDKEKFKERYCEVNHINSRVGLVCDFPGEVEYYKKFILKKVS